MNIMYESNYLAHYGVLGMKWGRRRAKKYTQRAASNREQAKGLTDEANSYRKEAKYATGKKRAQLNKMADQASNEAKSYSSKAKAQEQKANNLTKKYSSSTKQNKQRNYSDDHKETRAIKKKKVSEMSNEELKKVNTRMELEKKYNTVNTVTVSKGAAYLSTAALMTTTVSTLYNNGDKLINIGKRVLGK